MFVHKEQNIKLLVHGGNFFVLPDQLAARATLRAKGTSKKFDCRFDGTTVPDDSEDSRLTILNRTVSLDEGGVASYEADHGHAMQK